MSEDGGPAFPVQDAEVLGGVSIGWRGMSLRDWFAGMALQGILASWSGWSNDKAEAARHSYLAADAMLAERKKRMT